MGNGRAFCLCLPRISTVLFIFCSKYPASPLSPKFNTAYYVLYQVAFGMSCDVPCDIPFDFSYHLASGYMMGNSRAFCLCLPRISTALFQFCSKYPASLFGPEFNTACFTFESCEIAVVFSEMSCSF